VKREKILNEKNQISGLKTVKLHPLLSAISR